jgi:hypothetical protein
MLEDSIQLTVPPRSATVTSIGDSLWRVTLEEGGAEFLYLLERPGAVVEKVREWLGRLPKWPLKQEKE